MTQEDIYDICNVPTEMAN